MGTGHRLAGALGTVAVAALAAAVLIPAHASAQAYRQSAHADCGGYRSLQIPAAPGTCVSLIASGLGFPRGIIALSDTRLLVADMGSWSRNRGRLLLVTLGSDPAATQVQVLATRLDRPHGLARGPDGRIWLGEATRISEVTLTGNTAALRPVMTGAPGDGRHPLIGLAVMGDGQIAFSTGSATDDCAEGMVDRACAEATGTQARAAVRAFTPGSTAIAWDTVAPLATGLRNASALVFDPVSGHLWAGENGMDLPSPTLPPDELNRIEAGADYGWPGCFGMAAPAPGFNRAHCQGTATPVRNLPAHSAPLGIAILDGGLAGSGRALAIALHGHQPSGHRIVLVPINRQGLPAGQTRNLLYDWRALRGVRPKGAPVGLAVAPDGSLFVTEDRNGTVLRISPR